MTPAVCAIVVTYQPDTAILRQLLKQLNDSACDFWVIDNHSDNAAALRDDLSALHHCRGSTFLDHNVGQAQALNQALASVQAAGYGLAFLFDQDSGIESIEALTRTSLINALDACHGNRRRAAKRLKVSLRTIYNMINRYGLPKKHPVKRPKSPS